MGPPLVPNMLPTKALEDDTIRNGANGLSTGRSTSADTCQFNPCPLRAHRNQGFLSLIPSTGIDEGREGVRRGRGGQGYGGGGGGAEPGVCNSEHLGRLDELGAAIARSELIRVRRAHLGLAEVAEHTPEVRHGRAAKKASMKQTNTKQNHTK